MENNADKQRKLWLHCTNSDDKETYALKSDIKIESGRLVKAPKHLNGVLCTEHPHTSLCHWKAESLWKGNWEEINNQEYQMEAQNLLHES